MSDIPEHVGHLSDEAAAKFLNSAVLEDREPLPSAAIDRTSQLGRWPAERVWEAMEEAMKRFGPESRTAADAWLAPVLHATLRLTRREAADSSLWNHLALRVAPRYVYWRHMGGSSVSRARFSGPFHTQTFARLWWAAELFRDGPDYGPVVLACGNQDVLNTALRLEVILHRPTAQAMVRLLASGVIRTGREVNALAQAVNAAGSTLAYEALAPDVEQDVDSYQDWIGAFAHEHIPYDSTPEGPDDGRVPRHSVEALTPLFTTLFSEAPVRGQKIAP
ncbi:hypothetical protein J5X84_08960 [Streptosporangiaceae bacterium NEAU-GS5]|nr:hypothetical protein [Streptosporangiaceae bacterium NEAU-GS5]